MRGESSAQNYRAVLGDQDRVEIWQDAALISVGRWNGRSIVDCSPPLSDSNAAAILPDLAAQVDAEISAAWSALPAACNADGVDVTLIDWMLSLTPAERLAVLQDAADTFQSKTDDGDPIP